MFNYFKRWSELSKSQKSLVIIEVVFLMSVIIFLILDLITSPTYNDFYEILEFTALSLSLIPSSILRFKQNKILSIISIVIAIILMLIIIKKVIVLYF